MFIFTHTTLLQALIILIRCTRMRENRWFVPHVEFMAGEARHKLYKKNYILLFLGIY